MESLIMSSMWRLYSPKRLNIFLSSHLPGNKTQIRKLNGKYFYLSEDATPNA